MAASNLHDLFVHDLEDVYYAEKELVDAMEEMADGTEDEEIATLIRDHREETRGQIDRLERVFDMIDEEPAEEECEGIDGLIEEHGEFVDMDPDPSVRDVHNLISAQKIEHYEIAAYGNLALIADRLGFEEAGDVLHETLEEEEAALEKLAKRTDDFDFKRTSESISAD